MKRRQQRMIPAAGQQKHHHIFAAFNYLTQTVIWLEAGKKDTTAFLCFLEHLMRSLDSTKPVVLVLDNASYHHSAEAEAMLAFFEDDGLIACWLPPYCSELNPCVYDRETTQVASCIGKGNPENLSSRTAG